jgi:hypothetical protein
MRDGRLIPGQAVSAAARVLTYFPWPRPDRPAESRCFMPPSRSSRRTGSQSRVPVTRQPEEWFSVLDELLVRDRALDELATDRYARDRDPEKALISAAEQHRYRMFGTLLKRLGDWNCLEYARLLMGQQSLPYDPPPEVETRALRAVIEWVERLSSYPRYTLPEEKQELKELRDCLCRAAQDRLANLSGAGWPADCHVTLNQMAAVVGRSKRTLEKYKTQPPRRAAGPMPGPEVEGGGGRADEWKWSAIRPWLEQVFGRRLPDRFFVNRFQDNRAARS